MKFVFVFVIVSLLSIVACDRRSELVEETGTFFDSVDTNGDGVWSDAEVLARGKLMDKNGDGKLSIIEVNEDVMRYFTNKDDVKAMFDKYNDGQNIDLAKILRNIEENVDPDGDGTITRDDYIEFAIKTVFGE